MLDVYVCTSEIYLTTHGNSEDPDQATASEQLNLNPRYRREIILLSVCVGEGKLLDLADD